MYLFKILTLLTLPNMRDIKKIIPIHKWNVVFNWEWYLPIWFLRLGSIGNFENVINKKFFFFPTASIFFLLSFYTSPGLNRNLNNLIFHFLVKHFSPLYKTGVSFFKKWLVTLLKIFYFQQICLTNRVKNLMDINEQKPFQILQTNKV